MKKRFLLPVALLCSMIASAACAASRSGIVTLDVDLSAQDTGKEAKLWIPYPVTDRHQKVSDIKASGDFASTQVSTMPTVAGTSSMIHRSKSRPECRT